MNSIQESENRRMNTQNPMQAFLTEAPEVANAFDGLIRAISAQPGLNAKTRQLIYIAVKASQGDTAAVVAHVPMLKAAGGVRSELRDTILLTLTISGVKGIATCLSSSLDAFDQCQ